MGLFKKKEKQLPDGYLPKVMYERVATQYKTPAEFEKFRTPKNFNAEVQKKLQETGSKADTILLMRERVDAEGDKAKMDISAEYAQRQKAVEGFAEQRKGNQKNLYDKIDETIEKQIELKKNIEEEKEKLKDVADTKPWWATKKMLALMTVAFTAVDAYLFFLYTQSMNINMYMKYGLAVLLGLVITLVPILIAHCVRKVTSILEKSKGKYKAFTGITVFVWLFVFALTVYLRVTYADVLLEDSDMGHALALALFLAAIPLLTGVATFFISFEVNNPDTKNYYDLKEQEKNTEQQIDSYKKELAKIGDPDKRLQEELALEIELFTKAMERIDAECASLKAKINAI